MNRLAKLSFAKLPPKFGAIDSRMGRDRVISLFEKVTENRR